MKNQKYQTSRTDPKSNRQIAEKELKPIPLACINMTALIDKRSSIYLYVKLMALAS
jgi:hypothetical protein